MNCCTVGGYTADTSSSPNLSYRYALEFDEVQGWRATVASTLCTLKINGQYRVPVASVVGKAVLKRSDNYQRKCRTRTTLPQAAIQGSV